MYKYVAIQPVKLPLVLKPHLQVPSWCEVKRECYKYAFTQMHADFIFYKYAFTQMHADFIFK